MWQFTCVACPCFSPWPSKWRRHQQLWPGAQQESRLSASALCRGISIMKVSNSAKGTSSTSLVGPVAQTGFACAALGVCSSGAHLPVGFLHSILVPWGTTLSLRVPHCHSCQQQVGRPLWYIIYGELGLNVGWHFSTWTRQHLVGRSLCKEWTEKGQANSMIITLHKYGLVFFFHLTLKHLISFNIVSMSLY